MLLQHAHDGDDWDEGRKHNPPPAKQPVAKGGGRRGVGTAVSDIKGEVDEGHHDENGQRELSGENGVDLSDEAHLDAVLNLREVVLRLNVSSFHPAALPVHRISTASGQGGTALLVRLRSLCHPAAA